MFLHPENIKTLSKEGTSPILLKPAKVKDELCQVVKITDDLGTAKFYFGSDKLVRLCISQELRDLVKTEVKSLKGNSELPQDKINWKLPADAKPISGSKK